MSPAGDGFDRHLAIAQRIATILSIAVPTLLVFMAIPLYLHRQYTAALFYLALAAINVSTTVYLERRAERRRRALHAELKTLQRLLDERNAP